MPSPFGYTPLIVGAGYGRTDIVAWLLPLIRSYQAKYFRRLSSPRVGPALERKDCTS